jgi:hypothetical protein
MTPKTAPCFVHSGWYQDITPMTLPAPASILSATQTPFIAGPLLASCDYSANSRFRQFSLTLRKILINEQ